MPDVDDADPSLLDGGQAEVGPGGAGVVGHLGEDPAGGGVGVADPDVDAVQGEPGRPGRTDHPCADDGGVALHRRVSRA